MQARMQDVNNLVKLKNPSLLLQLGQKPEHGTSPERGGGSGSGSRGRRRGDG